MSWIIWFSTNFYSHTIFAIVSGEIDLSNEVVDSFL